MGYTSQCDELCRYLYNHPDCRLNWTNIVYCHSYLWSSRTHSTGKAVRPQHARTSPLTNNNVILIPSATCSSHRMLIKSQTQTKCLEMAGRKDNIRDDFFIDLERALDAILIKIFMDKSSIEICRTVQRGGKHERNFSTIKKIFR